MKLGRCLICGDRIESEDVYVTAEEGYAHTNCIRRTNSPRGISI